MADVSFGEPGPEETPDVLVPMGEQWTCPCGTLRRWTVRATWPAAVMQTKCPVCGTVAEHAAVE